MKGFRQTLFQLILFECLRKELDGNWMMEELIQKSASFLSFDSRLTFALFLRFFCRFFWIFERILRKLRKMIELGQFCEKYSRPAGFSKDYYSPASFFGRFLQNWLLRILLNKKLLNSVFQPFFLFVIKQLQQPFSGRVNQISKQNLQFG